MNISEFERTKPTKTMKLINDLIKDIENPKSDIYYNIRGSTENRFSGCECVERLEKIKQSLKNGE